MSFRRNLGRKQVSDKNYLLDLETLSKIRKIEPVTNITKVVYTQQFTVNNEDLLLVKTNESATIFLNENSNDFVTIKSCYLPAYILQQFATWLKNFLEFLYKNINLL